MRERERRKGGRQFGVASKHVIILATPPAKSAESDTKQVDYKIIINVWE